MKRANPAILHHIPPPAVMLAMLVTGWAMQRALWPPKGPATGLELGLGTLFLVPGAVLIVSTVVYLLASRTTVVPHRTPRRLLVGGPFRYTRNPVYVGAMLVHLGLGILLRAWLALPLVVVPWLFVTRVVVPMEEAALRAAFGRDYEDYCARVARWLA